MEETVIRQLEDTPRMSDDEATRGRRFGAILVDDGTVQVTVWAPNSGAAELVTIDSDVGSGSGSGAGARMPMSPVGDGTFEVTLPETREGFRYQISLDGGPARPDPASRWQPDGLFGPSAVVLPDRFTWTDFAWKGVARSDLVIYELHVGTFTTEGTLDSAVSRLPELRDLGVTAIELMPLAQFPGTRNWGYDGVLPYAVQDSYGGPPALRRFVDACHATGLAVIIDVVYNHLGPEGAFQREFGPYFTLHYRTPWGQAVNFDGAQSEFVRDYVVDNARMWLQEYHLDGLRLDAVHAIYDNGARHILQALAEVGEDMSALYGRHVHVIAESDMNDPRLLRSPEQGGYGLTGQWADDFHHAIHSLLTGERQGYYVDFGGTRNVARVLETPFLYAGNYSPYRQRKHGAPPIGLTPDRFVVCIQNHDQIGNRAAGDRLSTMLEPEKQRLAASLMLLSPYIPLLFMGEEYGETSPFPFFCSFQDEELIESVRRGRRREFSSFEWQGDVPDPQAEETFRSAVLSWHWEDEHRHGLRELYRDLLRARREWPALRMTEPARAGFSGRDEHLLEYTRGLGEFIVYFNLCSDPRPMPVPVESAELLFRSEGARYGGRGGAELAPFECVAFGPREWRSFLPE